MPSTLAVQKAGTHKRTKTDMAHQVRVSSVLRLAINVFGNRDKATIWFNSRNYQLAGRTPKEVLRSEADQKLLTGLLYQIDEGIYS